MAVEKDRMFFLAGAGDRGGKKQDCNGSWQAGDMVERLGRMMLVHVEFQDKRQIRDGFMII